MAYYTVLPFAGALNIDGKVAAPSKDAIVTSLKKMLIGNQRLLIAFSKIEDAQTYANSMEPASKNKEFYGFFAPEDMQQGVVFIVLEIKAKNDDLNPMAIEIETSGSKKIILEGQRVLLRKAEFVQAHLKHLDNSLSSAVVLNIAGQEVLGLKKAISAVTEVKDSDKNKSSNLLSGLLFAGAFVGATVAANASGLTAAVLAYAGFKAGVALTLAASAALVATASVVTYAAVSAVSKIASYVSSKLASKEEDKEENKADDKAEDVAKAAVDAKSKVVSFNKDAKAKAQPATDTTAKPAAKPTAERKSPGLKNQ